jgi:uncharacterized membrane protein YphA (DoxX/SURF4 family)
MTRLLSWPGHTWVALPVRWYLAVVFLLACWHKILDPGAFAIDIATYDILPTELVNLMALVMPWVEAATGVMLILGFRTRAAALLVAAMMAVFVAAVSVALSNGLQMSCGCFASQAMVDDPISGWTVARDVGWLLLAVYVLVFDRRPLGVDRWWPRGKQEVQA